MDESSWNILCKNCTHIYTHPTRGSDIVLQCAQSCAPSPSVSVLHSVVSHTTGVYRWLTESRTHVTLHQCNTTQIDNGARDCC